MIIADRPDSYGHVWVPQNAVVARRLNVHGQHVENVVVGVRRCLRCARLFPYNRKPEECEGIWHVVKVNDDWPKKSPVR